jgi:hypothetical protein
LNGAGANDSYGGGALVSGGAGGSGSGGGGGGGIGGGGGGGVNGGGGGGGFTGGLGQGSGYAGTGGTSFLALAFANRSYGSAPSGNGYVTVELVAPVPVPPALGLMGAAIGALALAARRRRG